MATTALHLNGVPGKPWSFSPKEAVAPFDAAGSYRWQRRYFAGLERRYSPRLVRAYHARSEQHS